VSWFRALQLRLLNSSTYQIGLFGSSSGYGQSGAGPTYTTGLPNCGSTNARSLGVALCCLVPVTVTTIYVFRMSISWFNGEEGRRRLSSPISRSFEGRGIGHYHTVDWVNTVWLNQTKQTTSWCMNEKFLSCGVVGVLLLCSSPLTLFYSILASPQYISLLR
jgi:hypothetical protein